MGGLVEIYWKEKEDGDNNLNARGQIVWQERLRHRRIKKRTQAAHGQHHTSGGIIAVSCSSGAIVVVGSSSCSFGYGDALPARLGCVEARSAFGTWVESTVDGHNASQRAGWGSKEKIFWTGCICANEREVLRERRTRVSTEVMGHC